MSSLPNAFVTLLTTPSYLPGALVLLHALRTLHPAPRDFQIVCLVTPETVDARTIGQLRKAGFDLVIGVEPIGSGRPGEANLNLMGRPDLSFALTKLHLFRLSPLFSTLIYLDADVLPLRPLAHLFTTTAPHALSACPDTGWPDCFNSGVMVIRPRESDWVGLKGLLKNGEGEDGIYGTGEDGAGAGGNGSFDGADQGLLNEWFSEEGGGGSWNRLPFTYNVTPTAAYTYAPAYRRYGHRINAVHFIGPNKPWSNLAGRPAGMSMPHGKEESFDYPALIDRWYAVYDKHVRPTAAHAPDLAQRFAVPETVAAWNASSASSGVPQQPDDKLDLSQLKAAAKQGVSALKSGQYTSLPLEGRIDLLMPRPAAKPKSVSFAPGPTDPPPPQDPSAISSPHHIVAPLPQTIEQQTERPATWDASRYSPPAGGGPEMAVKMDAYYAPAWEQPPAVQSSWYHAPPPQPEPQYPTIPDSVKRDTWYSNFTSTVPDPTNINPVFPWEQPGGRHHKAERVFPRGSSPPPPQPQAGHQRQKPSIAIQQPSPQPSPGAPAAPPRSMAEAMASYTNAWDSIPQIQRAIDRIPGYQHRRSASGRDTDMTKALQSVPGTPRIESSSLKKRDLSIDRHSEASGDGDDEDGEDSDDEMSGSSQSAGGRSRNPSESANAQPPLFPTSLPYNPNSSYMDRQSQTDRQGTKEVKVQAYPGGGPSPAVRTIPLPEGATRTRGGGGGGGGGEGSSSSAETTPNRVSLLTPDSDAAGAGTIRRIPMPPITFPPSSNSSQSATPTHQHPHYPHHQPKPSIDAKTNSGVPINGGSTRSWDPSTDVDVRKRDTQQVLSRFMRAGGFGSGSGGEGGGGEERR